MRAPIVTGGALGAPPNYRRVVGKSKFPYDKARNVLTRGFAKSSEGRSALSRMPYLVFRCLPTDGRWVWNAGGLSP